MPEPIENDDTQTDDDGMKDGVPSDVFDIMQRVEDKMNEPEPEDDDLGSDDDTIVNDGVDDGALADGEGDEPTDESGLEVIGWDAETIEKIKEINPDLLDDIKGLMEKTTIEDPSEDDEVVEEPEPLGKVDIGDGLTEEQLTTLKEKDPAMAAIIAGLNTQVGQLSESLNSVAEAEAERTKQAENRVRIINFKSANSKMDELETDYPVMGAYDKLPSSTDGTLDARNRSVKERTKLWQRANALHDAGVTASFDEAIDEAITWYRGKNAENLATRKIAKELKGRAKQITARPTQNKTKKKQYAPGSEAHKLSVMDGAFKNAGLEQ